MLTLQFVFLQIIVFSVLVFFLKKMLSGDTETNVKRLSAVYEELVKKQRELLEKNEMAEKEYQAKKEEAALIADKLSNQALDKVRKKEEELLKKARAEAEEIIAKAFGSRDQLGHEIRADVSKQVVEFMAEMLKKIFSLDTTLLVHGQFIKDFIKELQGADFSSVDAKEHQPVIRSAFPLTEEEKIGFQKILGEKLDLPELKIEEAVDGLLIAGVVLQIGTLLLDGSFANSVNESAVKMKEKFEYQG
ncbi:MAG: F0F1 ATP synthase subunit delta [Candidatus Omnitrophota bacterium]